MRPEGVDTDKLRRCKRLFSSFISSLSSSIEGKGCDSVVRSMMIHSVIKPRSWTLRLQDTTTGETLCVKDAPIILEKMDFPDPVIKVHTTMQIYRASGAQRNVSRRILHVVFGV